MSLAADDQFILLQSKDGISVPFKVERAEAADDLIILAKTADGAYVPMKVVKMDSADDQGFLVKTADGIYVPVKSQLGIGPETFYFARNTNGTSDGDLYRYNPDIGNVAKILDAGFALDWSTQATVGGPAQSGFFFLGTDESTDGNPGYTYISQELFFTNDNGDTYSSRTHSGGYDGGTATWDYFAASNICPSISTPGNLIYFVLRSDHATPSADPVVTVEAYFSDDYGETWSRNSSLENTCDFSESGGDTSSIAPGTLVSGSSGIYNVAQGYVKNSGYEIFGWASTTGETWSRTDLGTPGGNNEGGLATGQQELLANQYIVTLDSAV